MTISFGIRLRGDTGYNKFWTSWASMEKPQRYELIVPGQTYAADESARRIFRDFLTTKSTHILMLDDDAELAPQTLTRLMSRNLPAVGALAFTKTIPPTPTIWRGATGITQDGKYITWRTRVDDVVKWLEIPEVGSEVRKQFSANSSSGIVIADREGALSRTDNIGFHCALFRRDVIEAIGEPFCDGNEAGVHEDFDFSSRAIQAGFDLFVDKSVIAGHIGSRGIGAMDFWAWMTAYGADQQEIARLEDAADKNGGASG